jgi:hypothetical protein
MAIWQDLTDTCGFTANYQSVRQFVRKLRPSQSPETCVVIETAADGECQTGKPTCGCNRGQPVVLGDQRDGALGARCLLSGAEPVAP